MCNGFDGNEAWRLQTNVVMYTLQICFDSLYRMTGL